MTMKTAIRTKTEGPVQDGSPAQDDALEEVKVAGGSIVDDKPCFSADSRYLFVINDGKVHAYSASTGELAARLETPSGIVAVSPEPSNPRQLVTGDAAGGMVLWDFLLGTSLKKWSVSRLLVDGSTVAGLVRPAGAARPLLLLRRPGDGEPVADLVRLPREDGEGRRKSEDGEGKRKNEDGEDTRKGKDTKKDNPAAPPKPVLRDVRRGPAGRWELDVGCQGRLVAAIVKPDTVLVRNLWQKDTTSQKQYSSLRTDSDRPFTCVACHPSERTVAAGDASGRLLLWRRVLAGEQAPVRAVLHWHTLPLPSVAFSPEGTYLVSGGDECVLVYWQTHDEKPSFLPRLGMAIRHVTVSPDNQLVVTSHADNVLRLVTAQRQVSRVVRGLTWGAGAAPSTGLVLEPRTGALLLNGATGHLQLFSAHDRRDLFSLDVVQTNYLTRERTGALVTCDVTRVAVTSDGAWMATLEERDDGRTTAERRLKFWQFDEAKQSFVLNTCVEDPHDGTLTALEFQPGEAAKAAPLAVTTGTDGAIKYWSLVDDSDIYGSKRCWSCDAVGGHRRLPAACAAFSPDGTRLAVAFAAAVTVWAPEANKLQYTLSSVILRGGVRQVVFGRGECSHLLVSRSELCLNVWSLKTCTITAQIHVRATLLAVDPMSEYMAAFSATNKVFVFRPSSTRLVHQAALSRPVSAACFVPHRRPRPDLPEWQRGSQLFFLNDQQALHTLDHAEAADPAAASAGDAAITSHIAPTPFGALMAEQRRSAVAAARAVTQTEVTPGLRRGLEMLEAPSHTLPPLTRICRPFLEAMLHPRDRTDMDTAEKMEVADDDTAVEGTEGARASRRSGPRLETRLDHLLADDLSWLTV